VTERFADGLASAEERAAARAVLEHSYTYTVPVSLQIAEEVELIEFDNEQIQPIWLTVGMTGNYRRAFLIANLAALVWAQRPGDE
jgi:hypothetical protein